MIGTVLDKYEVLQKVGEGGMATVYRGRHTTLNREVAVKVLHPHLSSSTRNRKRFAREARAIEQLRHDNILEIFDYSGSSAQDCYIVTEFVGGKTLTEAMDVVGYMPSEVVSQIGIALSDALAYAHQHGVLHRDLKPDNVMIRDDGAVKLMDFGIARFLDESQVTMTGALVGSPAFMSPEQAKEGRLDARSDLFSLGTVLFYLATGHFPFHGSNPSLVLRNIIEGNRPHVTDLQPNLSATLVDTIEQLLQLEPVDRPNDADKVRTLLCASLDEIGPFREKPEWSIQRYLAHPDDYADRLDAVLQEWLLDVGKAHMNRGEPLAGLRLFNRLLTIDEDNEEVLTLVRGIDTGKRKKSITGIVGAVILCTLLIVGGLIWNWNKETGPTPPDDPTVSAKTPPIPIPTPIPEATTNPTEPATVTAPDPEPTEPQPPKVIRSGKLPTKSRPTVISALPSGPAVPPLTKEEPEVGRLELRVSNGWGYIYVDGVSTGKTTRDPRPLELPAGGHDIEIKSDFIEPYKLTAHVSPGETRRYNDIVVKFRPIDLQFDTRQNAECVAFLDGISKGTLAQNNYGLSIPRQLETNSVVVLKCGKAIGQLIVDGSTPFNSTFPFLEAE